MDRRKHPVHGVFSDGGRSPIIFLTVCTRERRPWLAATDVQALLVSVWRDADAWAPGRYVLMPDHLHLFAAPGPREHSLETWVRYWKSRFSKGLGDPSRRWQVDHWDTRLRSDESYDAKWEYVRNNPVRAGLARHPDEWQYQGEIHQLRW